MPVLATKLFLPPPRAEVVIRPRLLMGLDEGLQRQVMLVSAPAGFGKTTLVAQWLHRGQSAEGSARSTTAPEPLPDTARWSTPTPAVAWLSLDEADSDLTRFLTYLIAALQLAVPHLGEGALAALSSPQPPPAEAILVALLNDLATVPSRLILVLDDYHLIAAEPVDQALTFLIEHLPQQLRLVIVTREDPQLPLARLRARGQLAELRAAELRFTNAEAAELLHQALGITLAEEAIATLERRTEGWAAGLQLAAISLRGREDPDAFIRSFAGSDRYVMDYLVEEVLRQQPPAIQAFLLRTSILARLCGPLCDAVLCDPATPGQATLEALEQANLFLFPLDNERRWYRYHQLFGEVLRQRLHAGTGSAPGQSVAQDHLRASAWHEAHGLELEALRHAAAAGDLERVARLAEQTWQAMDESFQTAAWLSWVRRLPDTLLRARPVLSVQCAWAHMDAGEIEASEVHLRDAEHWLATLKDTAVAPPELIVVDEAQFRSLPGRIAIARAFQAQARGDSVATTHYAELALTLVPEAEQVLRAQASVLLGFTHWAHGDLEPAYRSIADWARLMRQLGNIAYVVVGAYGLAELRAAQGRLREAVAAYMEALRLASAHDRQVQRVTAHLHLGLAMLQYGLGDQEAAAQGLRESRKLGEQTPIVDWPYRWHLAQARLKEDAGEFATALELLDEAGRLYVRTPVPVIQPIAALRARVYLRQGRLDQALAWAAARGLSSDDELDYLREFEHLTFARALIASYRRSRVEQALRDALSLLARLLRAAEAGGRMASVIAILALKSLAHEASGDTSAALRSLEQALELAEPEGYVRVFVDEGPRLARLLAGWKAPSDALEGYRARLLAAFGTAVAPAAAANVSLPAEPLSARELEILHLIAEGLSNQAIGERLSLAVSTVKGHNLRIFGKLQVRRRTEAIARARELGLL